jgi:hypothetical protein
MQRPEASSRDGQFAPAKDLLTGGQKWLACFTPFFNENGRKNHDCQHPLLWTAMIQNNSEQVCRVDREWITRVISGAINPGERGNSGSGLPDDEAVRPKAWGRSAPARIRPNIVNLANVRMI